MFHRAGYFYLAVLGLTVVAFWPRYLGILPQGGISGYFHFHAIAMTGWFALLIAQPFLIRAGRRRVHRALGYVSYALVPVILVATLLLIHSRLPPITDAAFQVQAMYSYLPIVMLGVFALAYVLGVVHRRERALHARYMLCTGLALVDPIVARLLDYYLIDPEGWFAHARLEQAVSYAISAAILGVLIYRERGEQRGRAAFVRMLAAVTIAYGLWFVFAPTETWLAVMRWYVGLPLT